jgi:hypothetical protein
MKKIKLAGPSYQVMENPFEGLSEDQRRIVLKDIRDKAEKDVQTHIDTIRNILQTKDPVQALAMLSTYELKVSVGTDGVSPSYRVIRSTSYPWIFSLYLSYLISYYI